jgi:3'(2'), 5'-bisphosphate nucleotidase
MTNLNHHLITSIIAAIEAGSAILDVYGTDFSVDYKADRSPLTLADRSAHDIIVKHLQPFDIPILSEEGKTVLYDIRKDWDPMWIVDPLDGTKEFVNRNGEFTVNIALTKDNTPVLGVIYVPVKDLLYFALASFGTFKLENASVFLKNNRPVAFSRDAMDTITTASLKLPREKTDPDVFTIVGSRSHSTPALEAFVRGVRREKEQVRFVSAGSSMKFCLVAEGEADIYPRFGPTMEWDTAAGQAIAENAGFTVLDRETCAPLCYNKKDLLNPWFIVQPAGERGVFPS